MSVCSFGSGRSHVSFASCASGQFREPRTWGTNAQKPGEGYGDVYGDLIQAGKKRLMEQQAQRQMEREEIEKPRMRQDRERTQEQERQRNMEKERDRTHITFAGYYMGIRRNERRIDEYRSFQELLFHNQDKLLAKGLSDDHLEMLEEHIDDKSQEFLLRKARKEGLNCDWGSDDLTDIALQNLNSMVERYHMWQRSMLERWLQSTDTSNLLPETDPDVARILNSHDYRAFASGETIFPVTSPKLPKSPTRGPRLIRTASSSRPDTCDSVRPWQPHDCQPISGNLVSIERETLDKWDLPTNQANHDVLQKFMLVFEQWLDNTLAKYCPNTAGKSSSTSHVRDSGNFQAEQSKTGTYTHFNSNGKRLRDGDGPDEQDEEEEEGGPAKRVRFATSDAQPVKLACPFFKRNPERYFRDHKGTACVGDGWPIFHRVREHLYRRHALGRRCPRCQVGFQTAEALLEHQQAPRACQLQLRRVREGFNLEMETKIRQYKPKRKTSEGDKWLDVYTILFPDDNPETIPTPYFEDGLFESLQNATDVQMAENNAQYATYLREELPSIVRQLLQEIFQQEMSTLNERVQHRVVAAVENAQQIAYHRFLGEDLDTGTSAAASARHKNTRASETRSIVDESQTRSTMDRSSVRSDSNSQTNSTATDGSQTTRTTADPDEHIEETCALAEVSENDSESFDFDLTQQLTDADKDDSLKSTGLASQTLPAETLDWINNQVDELLPRQSFQDRTGLVSPANTSPSGEPTHTASTQPDYDDIHSVGAPYMFEFETESDFWDNMFTQRDLNT